MSEETRPGAAQWVPERLSLRSLREAAQECRGCELYRDATQVVMGEGRRDAAIMLLGEQPGDREDQEGEPFVGPAGRVLATTHPSAVLRADDREAAYDDLVADLRVAAERAALP
jgi:DNA polymerase